MGFSLSASTAIIGVALVMSIEIFVSTTVPTVEDVNDAYAEMVDRSIDQVQTAINITSHRTKPNGDLHDLNIVVQNTGSTTLNTSYFTILINGTQKPFTALTTSVYPQNTTEFTILALDGEVTNRVKVITTNGISDYYIYAVP